MKVVIFLLVGILSTTAVQCEVVRECKSTREGHDYQGTIKRTKSGILCQRWDATGDNAKNVVWQIYQNEPAAYPDRSISAAENYCRNPKTADPQGRESKPWCYTTISNNPKWEFCDIPDCPTCKTENREIIERALCVHGTRRLLHVSEKSLPRFRCEMEEKVSYKYCDDEVQCKAPTTFFGPCEGNVREIKTNYFIKNTLTGQCNEKAEIERHICKDTICKIDKMEVMIVMDSSMSIGLDNYLLQKRFVLDLVSKMKISINGIRVGLMQYSREVETVSQLENNDDFITIKQKIERMAWMNSQTATGLALNKVSEILRNQRRVKVPVAIILITDGNSNDYRLNPYNAIKESVKLKNEGFLLKIVTIGNDLKLEEMKAMASHPVQDNLYEVNAFHALQNWATRISKETCTDFIRPSPSLCSLKPIRIVSECYRGWRSITEIEYEKLEDGSCDMMTKSKIIEECNYVCHDPLTGNQYSEGEEWTTKCHKFKCTRLNPNQPLIPIETGCVDANGNCHKPNKNEKFNCKNARGEVYTNCACTMDANTNTFTTAAWNI